MLLGSVGQGHCSVSQLDIIWTIVFTVLFGHLWIMEYYANKENFV